MNKIRQMICFKFLFLLSLGNPIILPSCLGAEKLQIDLLLLQSIASPPNEFGEPNSVLKVGFSKNGQTLVCYYGCLGFSNHGLISLCDINSGKNMKTLEASLYPNNPTSDPYMDYCFTSEPYARLCIWTPTGLEVQYDLTMPKKTQIPLKKLKSEIKLGRVFYSIDGRTSAMMGEVLFSMNDEYLAAICHDNSISVWRIKDGEYIRRFTLPEGPERLPENLRNSTYVAIRYMSFDPTNRYLAVGIDDIGKIIVWDLKTGKEVLNADEKYRVFQVAFSPTGDLIAAECANGPDGMDESGRIIIRSGKEYEKVQIIHTPCGILCMANVPNVGLFTGDWHGQVLLWDLESGRILAVAKENGMMVVALAAGQNGKLIASGDQDSKARIWKILEQTK